MSFKFFQVAREVIRSTEGSPAKLEQYKSLLKALAPLHEAHIADIDVPAVYAAIQEIERRGARHMAHRARRFASLVFRYAIAKGQRKASDPTRELSGLLKPVRGVKSRAAVVTAAGVRQVLTAIRGSTAEPATKAALRFLPLVFTRPGEVRGLRWSEIDGRVWTIPSGRMKMRREHQVPLSRQALAVLDEVALEHPAWVFPGRDGPLSEQTLNQALVRCGVPRELHCPHGWRATARTVLEQLGEDPRVIELQLAHRRGTTTEQAYNRDDMWAARVAMMQRWADWLDEVMG